jgi:hypothetical protein
MSANRYIRFVELSSGLIRDSRIPLFSSKFSKKTYTQHQLLTLLLLKEYLSEDYRDAVELAEIMDSIRVKIHLDTVPHFTTIHKFSQRMRSSTFTRLLNEKTIPENFSLSRYKSTDYHRSEDLPTSGP